MSEQGQHAPSSHRERTLRKDCCQMLKLQNEWKQVSKSCCNELYLLFWIELDFFKVLNWLGFINHCWHHRYYWQMLSTTNSFSITMKWWWWEMLALMWWSDKLMTIVLWAGAGADHCHCIGADQEREETRDSTHCSLCLPGITTITTLLTSYIYFYSLHFID